MPLVAIGILVYCLLTLAIGLWVGRRVHNVGDFLVAGRHLSFTITSAALFATWFGSETILGSSGAFQHDGLLGVVEDPMGAALCLLLLGFFLARPLYRMGLYTFGDFYRERFGKKAELAGGLLLMLSYLGWVAGQLLAIGLVAEAVFGIDRQWGIVLGCLLVLAYTAQGGMWSISILDFVQNTLIIGGLLALLLFALNLYGWQPEALPAGHLHVVPQEGGSVAWLNYLAAWLAIGWGSLPQQDVYQRINSARSERIAVRASLWAGVLYLTIGFIPVALMAILMTGAPEYARLGENALPTFVMAQAPGWIQLLFMGALLSAIMSTASGAILAPAAVLSENLVKPLLPRLYTTPGRELLLTRLCVVAIAGTGLWLALNGDSVHDLVLESSELSLVSLFVPMVGGLWLRRTPVAALLSMGVGMAGWLIAVQYETTVAPSLIGLAASAAAYAVGLLVRPRS